MPFAPLTGPSGPKPAANPEPTRVWQVGALCHAVADALEARFGAVTVQGEISGFSRAASGHCYFTLKDAGGQLRCAMFRRAASLLAWQPREGDLVEVRGRLAVYAARGELQLVVESLRRAGQGALFEEFLRIKAALQAQGLFDVQRKRALTPYPRGIGLVTSLGAAALHDVATALRRRAPHVPVLLVPAPVQGAAAPAALVAALQRLYAIVGQQAAGQAPHGLPPIDTIVLVRGGGSIDDLWAFNDEKLAHTIVQSPVPLVVGVGHESDFTIADFCADLRAPTPTAAAELAALPLADIAQHTLAWQQRLHQRTQRQLEQHAQALDRLAWGLARTGERLRSHTLHLHDLATRLRQSRSASSTRQQRLDHLHTRLLQATVRHSTHGQHALRLQQSGQTLRHAAHRHLQAQHSALHHLHARWQQALQQAASNHAQRLAQCDNTLRLLHPQHLLERGFAVLQDASGRVLTQRTDFHLGQQINATVSDGVVTLLPVGQQAEL